MRSTLVIHLSRPGGPSHSRASSFCWNFDIPSTPTTWSDVGGIVSDFTPSSDVCLRLTDTDKDTIARVGLAARLLVFWCVFSLTLRLSFYRSKRFRSSLTIQKVLLCIVASYLTYELWTTNTSDIYFCWRRPHIHVASLLCDLSLTWKRRHFNIIGIYVHFFPLPARDTRLISTFNYHRLNVPFKQPDAHEHYTISLLHLGTKLSIVTFDWSIGGQTFKAW